MWNEAYAKEQEQQTIKQIQSILEVVTNLKERVRELQMVQQTIRRELRMLDKLRPLREEEPKESEATEQQPLKAM